MNKYWLWFVAAFLFLIASAVYSLSTVAFPFLLGLIGAYALNGLVSRMEKMHISRGVSSAILILGVLFLLTLLMIVAFPYLEQQLFHLAVSVPGLVDNVFNYLRPFLEQMAEKFGTPQPTELKSQLTSHLGDILTWSIRLITNLLTNGMALANMLSLIILSPIIMFYLLKDWPKLIAGIDTHIPLRYVAAVRYHAQTMDLTLSAYAKGQAIVCLVLMILYATTLWAIGLDQGVFVGFLTGFLSFIPYLGLIIGLLTSIAIAFTQIHGIFIWKVIAVFAIIGLIESNILSPRLIGEKVGLHPVWIIFSLLAGGTWFGFIGIILALPVAAMIGVLVRVMLDLYLASPLYIGDRAEEKSQDEPASA